MQFLQSWLLWTVLSVGALGQTLEVGISAAITGPNRDLGTSMIAGIEAYFARANQEGVRGSKLHLLVRDDGYVPKLARDNALYFANRSSVIAMIGSVGTPTARESFIIANSQRLLFFGAFTGAEFLRTPHHRYIVNFRPGYLQEAELMVDHLLEKGIRPGEIAFFIQNDAYGMEGYWGAIRALERRHFYQGGLVRAHYERNSTDVNEGVLTLVQTRPEPKAVIMFGTAAANAKAIKILSRVWSETIYFNPSFVSERELFHLFGKGDANIFHTQVVPPLDPALPGVSQFLQDLKSHAPDLAPDLVSFEGYLVAQVFVEGLKNAPGPITRESVIDGLVRLGHVDLGLKHPIAFDNSTRQFTHKVWLKKHEHVFKVNVSDKSARE